MKSTQPVTYIYYGQLNTKCAINEKACLSLPYKTPGSILKNEALGEFFLLFFQVVLYARNKRFRVHYIVAQTDLN